MFGKCIYSIRRRLCHRSKLALLVGCLLLRHGKESLTFHWASSVLPFHLSIRWCSSSGWHHGGAGGSDGDGSSSVAGDVRRRAARRLKLATSVGMQRYRSSAHSAWPQTTSNVWQPCRAPTCCPGIAWFAGAVRRAQRRRRHSCGLGNANRGHGSIKERRKRMLGRARARLENAALPPRTALAILPSKRLMLYRIRALLPQAH